VGSAPCQALRKRGCRLRPCTRLCYCLGKTRQESAYKQVGQTPHEKSRLHFGHLMKILTLHTLFTAVTNENWAMIATTWALFVPMAQGGRVWPASIKQTVAMTSTHQNTGLFFRPCVCACLAQKKCHESTHIACLVHSRDKRELGDVVYNLGSPVAYGPGRIGMASRHKPDRGDDLNSPKLRFYIFRSCVYACLAQNIS